MTAHADRMGLHDHQAREGRTREAVRRARSARSTILTRSRRAQSDPTTIGTTSSRRLKSCPGVRAYVQKEHTPGGQHTKVEINIYDNICAKKPNKPDPKAPRLGTLARRLRPRSPAADDDGMAQRLRVFDSQKKAACQQRIDKQLAAEAGVAADGQAYGSVCSVFI